MGRDELSAKPTQSIRMIATGETLCTRRHSRLLDSDFLALVSLIRGADLACTNLETRIHTFLGAPMPVDTMGMEQSYQQADPFVAAELKWMGFDLIGRSNNHGMDFGGEMLAEEARYLDEVDLLHAGAGENLAAATRPTYLETASGRVAFVSMCTDFPPHCPAGDQGPEMRGRPGINAIHIKSRYLLDGESYGQLQKIVASLGMQKGIRGDKILAFDKLFENAHRTEVVNEIDADDLTRNLRQLSEAKRASDYVVIHLHQETPGHYPAAHIQKLARALVDAGADVIVGDGPHLLQGVEIYKGRPIFYSLGNFFYQSETIKTFPGEFYARGGLPKDATPQDAIDYREAVRSGRIQKDNILPLRSGRENEEWFDAAVAEIGFDAGVLRSIRLHPISTYHAKRSQRGVPRFVAPDKAKQIIADLREYSSAFGTKIRDDGQIELA